MGLKRPYLRHASNSSHSYPCAGPRQTGGGRCLQWLRGMLPDATLSAGHRVVGRAHWGMRSIALARRYRALPLWRAGRARCRGAKPHAQGPGLVDQTIVCHAAPIGAPLDRRRHGLRQ